MRELNFAEQGYVKSGQKSVSESNPILEVTSGNNGFRLNKKAMAALGVKVGDRVVMFDQGEGEEGGHDNRYFICKAGFKDEKGVDQGSIIGANRSFTYGQIWGAIINDEPDVNSISFDSLIEKGLGHVTKNGSKVATRVCTTDLVPYGDEETVIVGGNERFVFRLDNLRYKDHTPKVITKKGEEVEDDQLPDEDED